MIFARKRSALLGLFACFLLLPLLVLGQGATQVLINYPELREEGDGLGLGLYFNIIDGAGRVNTGAQVQSARILLDDGTSYDAVVERPTSPIFITLVLDASGSMGGAAEAMRQAAIQAVNGAPQEAQFAVIRFNNAIDVLTEFTTDRNRVINAIGEVRPINLAGTCLYDATFRAIELMNTAPAGRRAIILFTDGRDETAQGTVCSQHVFNEVVDFANRPESRVPIHTIGLSGGNSAINAAELRDIASSTGGLTAIGDQAALGGLFGQIMDALRAQWLARSVVCTSQGQHTAQLLVTLGDGSFPQPALSVFIAPRACQITPTITPTQPTSTPTIVTVTVDSVAIDPATETIFVRPLVENGQLISEYRFEFKNEANLLQGVFVVPAPLGEQVSFPSRNLDDGDATVSIIGLNSAGQIVARSEPYEFTVRHPTPTREPPTNTPEPVSATLTSIRYDQETDIITLNISLLGGNQIEQFQINVVNGDTNLLEESYTFEPATTIQLPTTGLRPGGEYVINVIAMGDAGQIRSQSDQEFTYTPLLTPTPTATATPEPVSATLTSIQYDSASDIITLNLSFVGQNELRELQIDVVNDDTNLLVASYNFDPATTIQLPTNGLEPGQDYEINAIAKLPNGMIVSQSDRAFTYTPILTPTPTPVTVDIAISINVPESGEEFIIRVDTENETLIDRYELRLVESETGLLVNSFQFDTPPYNELRVPLAGIRGGQYEITLNALGENGQLLDSYVAEARITLPTPTPTATPLTGIQAFIAQARSNPMIIAVIALVAVALLLLLFMLLRPQKKKTGTSFLNELTQAQLPSAPPPRKGAADKQPAPKPVSGDDATNVVPFGMGGESTGGVGDMDATNIMPASLLPHATLAVTRSRDPNRNGQSVTVTHVPFTLGRRGRNFNFEGDDNVSRNHAEITYRDGIFYITDEGSTHGTMVNGTRLTPRMPTPLRPGSQIQLGTTTLLVFEMEQTTSSTQYDLDTTQH